MKLLHVINSLGGGGAEKLMHDLLPLLKRKFETVDILVLTSKNDYYSHELLKHNIGVYFISSSSVYNPFIIFKILPYLKKYSHIHIHLFPSSYWTGFSSFFCSQKNLFFTEHNTHNRRRNIYILRKFEKFIYNRFKKIIAISEPVAHNLTQWLPNTSKRIQIIHNGINFSAFNNASSKDLSKIIPENNYSLLMVGRFSNQKDHETIINALSLLPGSYMLLLAGNGKRKPIIEQLVFQKGLSKKVLFLGFRKDIPSLMKSVDINILSSHWEGFGLSAAEAMASGTPVLVSDVPGLKDVVGNKKMFFKAGNPQSLAEKIKLIAENYNLNREISLYGIERSKQFSLQRMADQYSDIYNNS